MTIYQSIIDAINDEDDEILSSYLDNYINDIDINEIYKYLINKNNYKYFEYIFENINIPKSYSLSLLLYSTKCDNEKFFIKILTYLRHQKYEGDYIIDNTWNYDLLNEASENRNEKIVRYLVNNFSFENLSLSIEKFACFNNLEMVKFLVENGGNADIKNNFSPIIRAIINNNLEMVKYFIEVAKVNFTFGNNYPLEESILNQNYEIMFYLLEKDAKLNDIRDINIVNHAKNIIRKNKLKNIYEKTTDI